MANLGPPPTFSACARRSWGDARFGWSDWSADSLSLDSFAIVSAEHLSTTVPVLHFDGWGGGKTGSANETALSKAWTRAIIEPLTTTVPSASVSSGSCLYWYFHDSAYEIKEIEVTDWRYSVAEYLKSWHGSVDSEQKKQKLSQQRFWEFYDLVQKRDLDPLADLIGARRAVLNPVFATFDLAGSPFTDFGYIELKTPDEQRDLSLRAVRSITEVLLKEIDSLDDATSLSEFLLILKYSLAREVAARVKWCSLRKRIKASPDAPSTRDWVIKFAFYTGNPPPAPGLSNLVTANRLVAVDKTYQELSHESVRRRNNTADLRNALRARSAAAGVHCGPRGSASLGRRQELTRRIRARPHPALAQSAGTVRNQHRREMACDIRLERRIRRQLNPSRAAVGGRP